MTDKPETEVYDIPGDLLAAYARGRIRRGRWTARALARRLDYLDDCIAADVVPDAKGRREPSKDGRKRWRAVPVPDELAPHMAHLAKAVAACRALLDAGDIAAAGARMDGIEALVADMARRATPARRRDAHCVGCSSRLDARG